MAQQHYGIKINLLAMKEATVVTLKDGRRTLLLDLTHAPSYIHDVPDNAAVYLDMAAFELKQPTRYGETHVVRPKTMPGEASLPIMGNMKPFTGTESARRRAYQEDMRKLREYEQRQTNNPNNH